MTFELWDNFWRKLVKTWDFKTSNEHPFQNAKFFKKISYVAIKILLALPPARKLLI